MKATRHVIPMPSGKGSSSRSSWRIIRRRTRPAPAHRIDTVLEFPIRPPAIPGPSRWPEESSARSAELLSLLEKGLPSSRSPMSGRRLAPVLTLAEIFRRTDAFEMGYNPTTASRSAGAPRGQRGTGDARGGAGLQLEKMKASGPGSTGAAPSKRPSPFSGSLGGACQRPCIRSVWVRNSGGKERWGKEPAGPYRSCSRSPSPFRFPRRRLSPDAPSPRTSRSRGSYGPQPVPDPHVRHGYRVGFGADQARGLLQEKESWTDLFNSTKGERWYVFTSRSPTSNPAGRTTACPSTQGDTTSSSTTLLRIRRGRARRRPHDADLRDDQLP